MPETSSSTKKLVIVCQITLDSITGSTYLNSFAKLFTKLGMHVEYFSLSDKNAVSDVYGYKQNQVALQNPGISGSVPSRIADFFIMGAFGFKPRIDAFSRSEVLTNALHEYHPDVIFVVDTLFAKTLARYKSEDPNVKIITYTDSPADEFNFTLTKSIGTNNESSRVTKFLKRLLEKKYLKYQARQYSAMIDASDVFVVPAKEHKAEVAKSYPNSRGKLFAIVGSYITKGKLMKRKRVTSIKKILFLSSYGPPAYLKLMDEIEHKMAPQLPDKEFIIHGSGCPERTSGNVSYSGKYLTLERLFADIDLCLCPLLGKNTGFKLKAFDYFKGGKIVIGALQSFLGYNVIDGYNAIVEDDLSKYPERIRQLDKNPKLIKKIQDNVYTALNGCYEEDALRFWSSRLKEMGVF